MLTPDDVHHNRTPERAGAARADPSSRLDPSSRTLRSRDPTTGSPSPSRLDQPTCDTHNRRNCSVNRNRHCLKVVDRFRFGRSPRHEGCRLKSTAWSASLDRGELSNAEVLGNILNNEALAKGPEPLTALPANLTGVPT